MINYNRGNLKNAWSDDDGIYEVQLEFNFLKQNEQTVIFEFDVEGVTVRSSEIKIIQAL